MDSDKEMTAPEAAAQLGYHTAHLYRLLAQGKVKGRKLHGMVWLISQTEVARIKETQVKGRLPRSDKGINRQ